MNVEIKRTPREVVGSDEKLWDVELSGTLNEREIRALAITLTVQGMPDASADLLEAIEEGTR